MRRHLPDPALEPSPASPCVLREDFGLSDVTFRRGPAFGCLAAFAMRTIISIIFGLGLMTGFFVCEATAQTSTNSPVRLKPGMFTDYEFTLISDKDYLYYYFQDNGSVEESVGNKLKNGGVVALGEGWRIEHGNTLVFTGGPPISAPDGSDAVPNPVRHTLQFKSFGEKIVVTMDGDKYRRSKLKRPN